MSLILADARTVSPIDFFCMVTGRPRPDRSQEQAYIDALNAHWRIARDESRAITAAGPQEGEDAISHLKRALAPIYAHERWERDQSALWHRGEWKP